MSLTSERMPGREAVRRLGMLRANKWLFARRLSQLTILLLFAAGPILGVWIAKGTLSSSMTLDVLPLTDPLVVVQSLAARHVPEVTAIIGVTIVVGVYCIIGGRIYCAWVCPINLVTDFAAWARLRFGITKGWTIGRQARNWILAMVVVVAAATGALAFELINPITAVYRAFLFGAWLGLTSAVAIFLFDLLVARHGWCGHLCPVGAAYTQLNRFALLRVSARGRDRCDDCMDCYAVCPEMHVIAPALKGERTGGGPVILSADCTACGRCIDVCPEQVFRFAHRFDTRLDPPCDAQSPAETTPGRMQARDQQERPEAA